MTDWQDWDITWKSHSERNYKGTVRMPLGASRDDAEAAAMGQFGAKEILMSNPGESSNIFGTPNNPSPSNNNINTGDAGGMMLLAAFLGGLWILYLLFPFIGLGAGGYGGWRLGKKISGTTLAIILSVTGSLGGFGLASAMIDSFNNGETTTEDVYVPAP